MAKKPGYCTGFRQAGGDTQTCCQHHDVAYQVGHVSRLEADIRLMVCVAQHGHPWRAIAMFMAVRAFGWAFYKG